MSLLGLFSTPRSFSPCTLAFPSLHDLIRSFLKFEFMHVIVFKMNEIGGVAWGFEGVRAQRMFRAPKALQSREIWENFEMLFLTIFEGQFNK